MSIDFPLILVILVFGSGLIWAADALMLAPARRRTAEALQTRYPGWEQEGSAAEASYQAELHSTAREPLVVEYARSFFPVLAVVFVLTSILFALGGFINAVYANSFDDISIIPTFVLTPLTYLGGVFYSIHLLPEIWQKVSLANPVLYMVNAFRYGVLGVSDVSLAFALAMIAFFTAAAFAYSMYLLNSGTRLRQ